MALPAVLAAMFVTESVANTGFTNINGCIPLAEVVFRSSCCPARSAISGGPALRSACRWWSNRCSVLLLIPLLNRQWRTLAAAFAVPIAVNAAAWPLVSDAGSFVHNTLPYILGTRDYFNSSILGNGTYYGLPLWLIMALRALFVALAAASLWLLLPVLPRARSAVLDAHVVGRLLVTSWLVLSPAQGYSDDAVPVPHDGGAAEFHCCATGRPGWPPTAS